jgi:hypothetical protein
MRNFIIPSACTLVFAVLALTATPAMAAAVAYCTCVGGWNEYDHSCQVYCQGGHYANSQLYQNVASSYSCMQLVVDALPLMMSPTICEYGGVSL